jgi:hypothetical protein
VLILLVDGESYLKGKMKYMTKEQLDLLFEYIESRLHTFVKGLPPNITIGLKEREKEIKEKLYSEIQN